MTAELQDCELVLLDGQCSPDVQRKVDVAKRAIAISTDNPEIAETICHLVSEVIEEAMREGKLIHRSACTRYCKCCRKLAGYATYKRTSGRHNKGDRNLSKPLIMWGQEFADTFVRIENHITVGACSDCCKIALPLIVRYLEPIMAEIPRSITGHDPRFRKHRNQRCKACGWTGHEGQMRKLRTLIGDGFYPGGCPSCPAENHVFDKQIISHPGFTVVPSGA